MAYFLVTKNRIFRADEPQVIFVLRIIFETIWTILRVNFQLLKALALWVVPPEPKDVTDDIVLVSLF